MRLWLRKPTRQLVEPLRPWPSTNGITLSGKFGLVIGFVTRLPACIVAYCLPKRSVGKSLSGWIAVSMLVVLIVAAVVSAIMVGSLVLQRFAEVSLEIREVKTPPTSEDRAGWNLIWFGGLLFLAGVAGVVFAWFPPPPQSTQPPMTGWPARWFAGGVGWFGLCVATLAIASRWFNGGWPVVRRLGRLMMVLAIACWSLSAASCLRG